MRGVKQGVKCWTSASVEANKYQIKDTILLMDNQTSYLNDLEIDLSRLSGVWSWPYQTWVWTRPNPFISKPWA